MDLRLENYLPTKGASVPDRLIEWAIKNLTEDDIIGEISFQCGCPVDSDYECNATYIYLMEGEDNWESWMDGINERNLIDISYCYDCKKWTIDWDPEWDIEIK